MAASGFRNPSAFACNAFFSQSRTVESSAFCAKDKSQSPRRPRFVTSAAQQDIPRRPDQLNDAVRSSREGRFHESARKLRDSVPSELAQAAVERRRLACDLLNPVTLTRVAESSQKGGAELFDNGVRALYAEMARAGLLPALGSERSTASSKPGSFVTVEDLVKGTGLLYASLSPRRGKLFLWQLAGIGVVSLTMYATRVVGLGDLGGPLIGSIGLLLAVDQVALRGTVFETVYGAVAPNFRDRIVHHEAAHFIVAYLCGLQISGYVTSGRDALVSGIPSLGQGGTIFSFPELSEALQSGKLKARTIDIWSTVLMAGIAAEALTFGQAEGGASDEETLINLLQQLNWDANRVKSQARFGVLQAVLLLREHNEAYLALTKKMKAKAPLGDCIDCIEGTVTPKQTTAASNVDGPERTGGKFKNALHFEEEAARIARREAQVLSDLAELKRKISEKEGDSSA